MATEEIIALNQVADAIIPVTGSLSGGYLSDIAFNGYSDSLLNPTYTGGELAVKDWENKLQISPANVLPSGGRLSGGLWVDNDGLGNDLHPYTLINTEAGQVKKYYIITERTNGERVEVNTYRQWGGYWFICTSQGTTGVAAPSPGVIGDTLIADGTVEWTNSGYYKLERRYLNVPAVTNKCLADYPRPSDGAELSSGSPTIGKRYRISAQSLVDFTTVGAANNTVGTEFVATSSGVTLTAADKLIPIIDGLGTVSKWDGVSAFSNNISNLNLSGDQAATLTVVVIPAANLEGAVDEHGETVDLTDYVQTHDGDYLGYSLYGGSTTSGELRIEGFVTNLNKHTYSIFASGGTGRFGDGWVAGSPISLNSTLTRIKAENITPGNVNSIAYLRANALQTITFLLPNLTQTTTTMPLMEANTTRAANVITADWPSSVTAQSLAVSVDAIPMQAGQTSFLWSNDTDESNFVSVTPSPTSVRMIKEIAGDNSTVGKSYSHAALTLFSVDSYANTDIGIGIRIDDSSYSTVVNLDAAVLFETFSIGARNGASQFHGYIPSLKIYKTKALMESN